MHFLHFLTAHLGSPELPIWSQGEILALNLWQTEGPNDFQGDGSYTLAADTNDFQDAAHTPAASNVFVVVVEVMVMRVVFISI